MFSSRAQAQLKRVLTATPDVASAVDADGDRTPLHWAAARGNLRCIQLLLDGGADLAARDAHGRTAQALALALNQHAAHDVLAAEGGVGAGERTAAIAKERVAAQAQQAEMIQIV